MLPRGVCIYYIHINIYIYIYIYYIYIYIVYIYIYIYIYISIRQVLSTGLHLMKSLLNKCHWAVIIDITIFELFEPPSYDFYSYNDLEQDTRQ